MRRFLVIEVIGTHKHREEAIRNMVEVEQLIKTFGGELVVKSIQHRAHPHPATHIGRGKLEWLKTEVTDKQIEVVIINALLKPSVLFRIEKYLWPVNQKITVWDRVDLILAIFDKHAMSKEAKLQIELARLSHTGPRIYGLGGKELSRQGGGIGQRGGYGETNVEFEKRQIKQKGQKIKKELIRLAKLKHERVRFRKELGLGPVALVGYTSAGKTTLFNALTGKNKAVKSDLFTTLDTVVGKMKTPDSRVPILISDTIGFIDNLPPNLIEAFKSTLIETLESKLILHVVDITDPRRIQKIEVVNKILTDLSIKQPVWLVLNKIDRLETKFEAAGEMMISAKTGENIDRLKELIVNALVA